MMYSIGEFSQMTGLSVRTLRFYHEKGLLVPASIDADTGYRFYDEKNLDVAQVIVALRELEFSLDDIGEILANHDNDADLLDWLEAQKQHLLGRLKHHKNLLQKIDQVLCLQRDVRGQDRLEEAESEICERELEPQLVAGIRVQGRYSDCGKAFSALFRRFSRFAHGKPLCLYYDGEYREEDANFEPCLPLRKEVAAEGFHVRELAGCRCLSLVHRGPYEKLRYAYARLLRYAKQHKYDLHLPSREVYLKGPGMIFKGNPKKYLTEIQLPLAE